MWYALHFPFMFIPIKLHFNLFSSFLIRERSLNCIKKNIHILHGNSNFCAIIILFSSKNRFKYYSKTMKMFKKKHCKIPLNFFKIIISKNNKPTFCSLHILIWSYLFETNWMIVNCRFSAAYQIKFFFLSFFLKYFLQKLSFYCIIRSNLFDSIDKALIVLIFKSLFYYINGDVTENFTKQIFYVEMELKWFLINKKWWHIQQPIYNFNEVCRLIVIF